MAEDTRARTHFHVDWLATSTMILAFGRILVLRAAGGRGRLLLVSHFFVALVRRSAGLSVGLCGKGSVSFVGANYRDEFVIVDSDIRGGSADSDRWRWAEEMCNDRIEINSPSLLHIK